MQSRNTPIAVWHGQPFVVPVLDSGMRWALVRYRKPKEQPRKFSLMKNLFVVRRGQPFGAVGNESCTRIRVMQFRWWIGWPTAKTIQLAVSKLSEGRMPEVNGTTPIPHIIPQVAKEIEQSILQLENTPSIALRLHSNITLNVVERSLQLNTLSEEPNLKTFHDTL